MTGREVTWSTQDHRPTPPMFRTPADGQPRCWVPGRFRSAVHHIAGKPGQHARDQCSVGFCGQEAP